MPSSARVRPPANTPEDLHAIVQDAINRADLDAFLDAHDDDAAVVVPPDGRSARGRDEIHAAARAGAPAGGGAGEEARDRRTGAHTRPLALGGTVTEEGNRSELHGLGTMVARRRPDGTWRIVLDDPLSGQ